MLGLHKNYYATFKEKMMKKYRKKPIIIEAIQLTESPKRIFDVYSFINGEPNISGSISSDKWDDYINIVRNEGMRLKTLESDGETQVASIGDYVIKGIKGEFYPCKPDIFEMTYELYTPTDKRKADPPPPPPPFPEPAKRLDGKYWADFQNTIERRNKWVRNDEL